MDKNHDCHKCIFKKQLSYTHHISRNVIENSFLVAAYVLRDKRLPFITKIDGVDTEIIEINPHGIEKGWTTFSINFDPIWINKCLIYKENDKLS